MNIVEVKGLSKEYGLLTAVKDVSFTMEPGQVIGLIGPNGAGKTTLLRMLATLLKPTQGEIRILGHPADKEYLAIRAKIGYLPDFFNLYSDLTLEECLYFFAKSHGIPQQRAKEEAAKALEYVHLTEKRGDMIRHLSRGMVQRLGLAALLVHDPALYLLDEPASGLDPKARIHLREILLRLSSQGKTILISSHILTELSGFCSHIAIMNRGEFIKFGHVDAIRQALSGGYTVRLSVLDRLEEAAALVPACGLPITAGEKTDHSLLLHSAGGREAVAAFNKLLVEKGIGVYGLQEEKMGLEDLFMKLSTQEEDN